MKYIKTAIFAPINKVLMKLKQLITKYKKIGLFSQNCLVKSQRQRDICTSVVTYITVV